MDKRFSDDRLIVLLSDGSIIKLNVASLISGGSGFPVHLINGPSTIGSVGYDKIDGDALYMLSTSGTFVSRDSGSTWQIDTVGIGTAYIWDIAIDSLQYVYAATDHGLFNQNPDSNAWHKVSSFTLNNSLSKIFIDRKNRIFLAGNSRGIYISSDNGSTWSIDTTGVGNGLQFINTFGDDAYGNVYAATSSISATPNAIFKSSGGSSAWTRIDQGITAMTVNSPTINSIGGNSTLFAGTSFGKILKSTDSGTTWVYDTLGLSSIKTGIFYADENGTQHIATTQYGGSFYEMIYQKIPNGSWTPDTSGIGSANYSYSRSMSSDNHGTLYLSGYFKLQNSSAAAPLTLRKQMPGGSWLADTVGIGSKNFSTMATDRNGIMYGTNKVVLLRRTSQGWLNVPFPIQLTNYPNLVAFSFDSSNALFAAFQQYSYPAGNVGAGVFYSTDQGANWTFVGLDSLNVKYLSSFGNTTYAVTDRGIFIVNKNGATAVKVQNQIPLQYELYQNYPNPFNPATAISYQLSAFSHVTLKVYDVLGNEIKTLVNEYKPAGKYTVNFDASKLASGVYFYRLNVNDYTSTKKLLLLK